MNRKTNALDVLSFIATIVITLSGNITGALLVNVFYGFRFIETV